MTLVDFLLVVIASFLAGLGCMAVTAFIQKRKLSKIRKKVITFLKQCKEEAPSKNEIGRRTADHLQGKFEITASQMHALSNEKNSPIQRKENKKHKVYYEYCGN